MVDLSPMAKIEHGVYGQLESSKKIFQIVQSLTIIAREVEEKHQDRLQELTKELLQIGKDLSDNAEQLGKDLGELISRR